jgi:hypothetical protein
MMAAWKRASPAWKQVELEVSVAKLEGRVSQLPTTIQMIGFIVVLAIAGGTKYLGV